MAEKAGAMRREAKEAFREAKEAVETETSLQISAAAFTGSVRLPGLFCCLKEKQVLAELAAEYQNIQLT